MTYTEALEKSVPDGSPREMVLAGAELIVADARTVRTGPLFISDGFVVDELAHPETASSLDVSGCVLTAGLVNAHHHLLQTAFRTLPGTRMVPMKRWLEVMGAAYRSVGVTGELTHAAATVGVAESLLYGVTTVCDHHLTWPAGVDPLELVHGTLTAATELHARIVFVRGTARDDPDEAAQSVEAMIGSLFRDAEGGVNPDHMRQLAVGPSGVHADGQAMFETMRELAVRHGLRRRTQANEQIDVTVADELYGRRPLDLLEEWGWVEPGVTIAHLCEVTEAEVARLGRSGVTATHAPGCDVPMGWGISPVAALRDAGVTVGLGTSGGGSNDAGHLLADARLAMQISGLTGHPITAIEALAMATEGSAAGIGRPELGHLRSGAAADVCVWDVSGAFDAGVADRHSGLLWTSPGRRPRDVFVAGRHVVDDGVLQTADQRASARRLDRILH